MIMACINYAVRTLQKCQRVHVRFDKSSVFLENPTRVRHQKAGRGTGSARPGPRTGPPDPVPWVFGGLGGRGIGDRSGAGSTPGPGRPGPVSARMNRPVRGIP
ncbi:hypothetical protein H5410_037174 [Solanum commersonii]|uniref:Uncharacterized protein n=1 Tax=Solanum commersonii TaxID=4109 RepID=A0A9J5YAF1_SOLCO|nr:hypothetical protein H5410_037174 [Solanum commersonii]